MYAICYNIYISVFKNTNFLSNYIYTYFRYGYILKIMNSIVLHNKLGCND